MGGWSGGARARGGGGPALRRVWYSLPPTTAWCSAQPWRSGCLGRRRGQMKGIGAAGGGGPPRSTQSPSCPRPLRLLGRPCAVQTSTAPSPRTMRASVGRPGPRGGAGCGGSALPADGGGLSPREAASASFVGEVRLAVGCSFLGWPRGSAGVPGERD